MKSHCHQAVYARMCIAKFPLFRKARSRGRWCCVPGCAFRFSYGDCGRLGTVALVEKVVSIFGVTVLLVCECSCIVFPFDGTVCVEEHGIAGAVGGYLFKVIGQ